MKPAPTLSERIQSYLGACPGAISGQSGHTQTFLVALKLYHGFGLTEAETLDWLNVYNRQCQPAWSETELKHKASEAARAKYAKPRGHLIEGNGSWHREDTHDQVAFQKPRKKEKFNPPAPELASPVPADMVSPTEAFLLACFNDGESVSIAEVVTNKEGRCIPDGAGRVYTRELLLQLLQKNEGDPNRFILSDQGAYVRVNPVKGTGATDSDVTEFRHCLVEFDKGTPEEQWNHIIQSNVPCAVILTSGLRSIHAWVKINAKDKAEYDERVAKVYQYFEPLGADRQNKNPSRFSRLPGMIRNGKPQQLLAVNRGVATYEQWLVDLAASSIGRLVSIDSLLSFVPEEDPNCLIGNRWLCRGGSLVIVGQTHIGKSSFGLQMAIAFALGLPFFGIKPPRKLRSVYIQAENDDGDVAEALQGILMGAGYIGNDLDYNKLIAADLRENLFIIQDQSHVGLEFASAAEKLIAKYRPDLFFVDPFLSFYGDDINDQKACSTFLRSWMNPVSTATGVCWIFQHHTPKPQKDGGKGTKGWTSLDYAYMGLGSSELSNWARAIIYLHKVGEDEFRAIFAKRGYRAGLMNNGIPTNEIYLAHSSDHICWKQIPKPDEDKNEDSCTRFVNSLGSDFAPQSAREIIRRAESFLKRGNRTLWKLWDSGSGPLGSKFVRDGSTGLYRPDL